jgi:Na+-transporting NADH:ubiquinone oxidoreductase subunit NqrB
MPKKKRRPAATVPTFKTTAGWRWRSFPVFFAFVCGAFAMGLLNGVTNPVGAVFLYLTLLGVTFGIAHMVTRRLAEWRMRRRALGTPAPSTEAERGPEERRRLPEGARRRR